MPNMCMLVPAVLLSLCVSLSRRVYVCVCVYVFMCVRMYVCMYFCMHLYRDTAPLNTKSIRPQPCWLESKTGKHRSCGWDHLCKHKIPTYMHTYNMRMPACILGCVHNYIGAHTRTHIHARAHTHTDKYCTAALTKVSDLLQATTWQLL